MRCIPAPRNKAPAIDGFLQQVCNQWPNCEGTTTILPKVDKQRVGTLVRDGNVRRIYLGEAIDA